MKAWAAVLISSIPLAWSLLAASDALWTLGFQVTLIGTAFLAGYILNRQRVPARLLILCGLPLMVLAPAFALSADGTYLAILVSIFVLGTSLVSSGVGTIVRRHIWPMPWEHKGSPSH